jgi:hypothetical protein
MTFDRNDVDEFGNSWARECGRRGAAVRTRCVWCQRTLRPCNLRRHISATHYRQLTIDEVIESVELELPGQAIDW